MWRQSSAQEINFFESKNIFLWVAPQRGWLKKINFWLEKFIPWKNTAFGGWAVPGVFLELHVRQGPIFFQFEFWFSEGIENPINFLWNSNRRLLRMRRHGDQRHSKVCILSRQNAGLHFGAGSQRGSDAEMPRPPAQGICKMWILSRQNGRLQKQLLAHLGDDLK